jgi:hypothetical protein
MEEKTPRITGKIDDIFAARCKKPKILENAYQLLEKASDLFLYYNGFEFKNASVIKRDDLSEVQNPDSIVVDYLDTQTFDNLMTLKRKGEIECFMFGSDSSPTKEAVIPFVNNEMATFYSTDQNENPLPTVDLVKEVGDRYLEIKDEDTKENSCLRTFFETGAALFEHDRRKYMYLKEGVYKDIAVQKFVGGYDDEDEKRKLKKDLLEEIFDDHFEVLEPFVNEENWNNVRQEDKEVDFQGAPMIDKNFWECRDIFYAYSRPNTTERAVTDMWFSNLNNVFGILNDPDKGITKMDFRAFTFFKEFEQLQEGR